MIVGTATLRIVLSRTMMNNDIDNTTSPAHRFGSDATVAPGHRRWREWSCLLLEGSGR